MTSFVRQFDFHDVIYHIQPCNVENRRHNVFTTIGRSKHTYRPVALLSCIGMLQERIVFKNMYNFPIENNLLYKYQSGFLPHHSTVFQLIDVFHNACQVLIKTCFLVLCSVMFQKLLISSCTMVFLCLRAISGIVHTHHSCGGKRGKIVWEPSFDHSQIPIITVLDTLTSNGYFRISLTK